MPTDTHTRLLITAGPTHEPIDAVRYLANRSSGRLGIDLANAAADRGLDVLLLLGPTPRTSDHPHVRTVRFQTTADLEALLREHLDWCDALVMAAAVADYRPKQPAGADPAATKLRRMDAGLVLELEGTPDLLAGCAARARPDQKIVGFALEPAERLSTSARDKLERKNLSAIVANPLETMDAVEIEATVFTREGANHQTDGRIPKDRFANWILDTLDIN